MFGKKYTRILRQVIAAVFIVAQTNILAYFGFSRYLASSCAQASFPNTVGYQGRLKNSAGTAQTEFYIHIQILCVYDRRIRIMDGNANSYS